MIFDLLVEWALCYSIKVIEWTGEFILHPTIALVAVYQYNARARHFGFLHAGPPNTLHVAHYFADWINSNLSLMNWL